MTIVTGPFAHSAASTARTARMSSWWVRAGSMPSSGDGWPNRCSRPLTSAARCSSSVAGPIRSDRRCSSRARSSTETAPGSTSSTGPSALAIGHHRLASP